ncbi:MAG: helix-turn-helix transcriptional regulator [Blastochloris sp.]|nr:helix-turn-helix transcriptional regulator [Blastochloris sp.]
MSTGEQIPVTRSLEVYRREQLLTVKEFAAFLGMAEDTYRRLLADPSRVSMPTKRRAREALGVSPYHVLEFYPEPTPDQVARALAAYEAANKEGWIATDPLTGEPTGEIFDGDGNLL